MLVQPPRSLPFFATYTCAANAFLYLLQLISDTSPSSSRVMLDFIGPQSDTSVLYNKLYLLFCDSIALVLQLTVLAIAYEEQRTSSGENRLDVSAAERELARQRHAALHHDSTLEPLIDTGAGADPGDGANAPPALPLTTEPTAMVRWSMLWEQI